MKKKQHLRNKLLAIISIMFLIGCTQRNNTSVKNVFEKLDVCHAQQDTILLNNKALRLVNGVYYFEDKPFSGYIKEIYNTNITKSNGSYLEGRQHGTTKTYFPNGKLETERNYKNGVGYGRHFGFWENGNKKFDFTYYNDKREGLQKQWYASGHQYCALNYTNDRENGMQKAWRENGKPYINYEVKDGVRYGLQKSALCYTLKDGKINKSL